MKPKRLLMISISWALLIAGCSKGEADLPVVTATATPLAASTQAPVATEDAIPTATPTASDTSSLDPEGPIPKGSSALRASEPGGFQRAAGQPQLVEFFAFW